MALTISTGDIGTIEGTVAADLTGATAVVNVAAPNGTPATFAASITDATGGAWSIAYTAEDFTLTGRYLLEVEVTFSNGNVQTFAHDSGGRALEFRARSEIA